MISVFFSIFLTMIFSKNTSYIINDTSRKNLNEKYKMFSMIANVRSINPPEEIPVSSKDEEFIRKLVIIKKSEELIKQKKYSKSENLLSGLDIRVKWIGEIRDSFLIKTFYLAKKYKKVISFAKKSEIPGRAIKYFIKSYLKINSGKKALKLFSDQLKVRDPAGVLNFFSRRDLQFLMKRLDPEIFKSTVKKLINSGKFSVFNKIKRFSGDKDLINYYSAEMYYAKKRYDLVRKTLLKIKNPAFYVGKTKLLLKIDIRENRFSNIDLNLEKIRVEKDIYQITLLDIASILKIKGEFKLSEKYYQQIINRPDLSTDERNYWKALWRMGWLNMKSGDKKTALNLFKIGTNSPIRSYKIANSYWEEKLSGLDGNKFPDFPYSYYYQKYLIGKRILKRIELKNFIRLIDKKAGADLYKVVSNIEIILKSGLDVMALRYIKWIKENSSLKYEDMNTIKIIESIVHLRGGNFFIAFSSFKNNFPDYQSILIPNFLKSIYTPMKFSTLIKKFAKENNIDKNIVFALIKRESFFNKDALSPANAMGLMQLLSKTAKKISKKLNIKIRIRDLYKPEINIKLGTYHLKELLERYNGKKYLALAAYNAGSHRVDRWIKEYGSFHEEEFIEMIPFTETRNYVKKVLRNYYFYNYYYN